MALLYDPNIHGVLIVGRGSTTTCTQPLEVVPLPVTTYEIKVEPPAKLPRLSRADLCCGKCHCGSGIDARYCGCHKPARVRN